MGELTKASNALQNEIMNAKRKLVLLQGANKHLQRLMTDYNKKVSAIVNEVKSDPQFADKQAKMNEIDRRTDSHWEKLKNRWPSLTKRSTTWRKWPSLWLKKVKS